jgi:hypothetical protein
MWTVTLKIIAYRLILGVSLIPLFGEWVLSIMMIGKEGIVLETTSEEGTVLETIAFDYFWVFVIPHFISLVFGALVNFEIMKRRDYPNWLTVVLAVILIPFAASAIYTIVLGTSSYIRALPVISGCMLAIAISNFVLGIKDFNKQLFENDTGEKTPLLSVSTTDTTTK